MRECLILSCAFLLAACGPGSTPADAESSNDGATTLAQNDATAQPAVAGRAGPDLSGLPEAYQSANIANGRQNWFLCAACHQIANGASHAVGPDLHGVFGETAGSNATFPLYSPALKESGIVWTAEAMDTWFANPREVIPSTTMIFPGIRDAEDRRDLIGYLWVETGGTEASRE